MGKIKLFRIPVSARPCANDESPADVEKLRSGQEPLTDSRRVLSFWEALVHPRFSGSADEMRPIWAGQFCSSK